MRHKLQTLFLLGILLVLVSSCRDRNNGVPLVAVDKEINLSLPSYSSLAVVGGWSYVSGGSKGLLVYRKTQEDFVVFDRHSPYNVDAGCIVHMDSSSYIEVIDPCSSTKYSIFDGNVTSGEGSLPLKQYNWEFNGTILRIYN